MPVAPEASPARDSRFHAGSSKAHRQGPDMAAVSLLVRQGVARGVDIAVVQLVDRRRDPPGDAQEWTFQRDVEAVLYGNGYAQTTGVVDPLLLTRNLEFTPQKPKSGDIYYRKLTHNHVCM